MNIEYKNIAGQPLDVDTSTGRKVKVVISEMGSKDLDNDVIEDGAFKKTISDRGPKGANLIWHLTDHWPDMNHAIGKFSELYTKNNQLIGVTDIPNTTLGNDMLEHYKSGNINQHSIGFTTVKAEVSDDQKEPRMIKEVKLYEGSAVLWGSNPNTPTLEAGKSEFTSEHKIETMKELQETIELLLKSYRNGKFSDNAFEFMEIRIKQLLDKLAILTDEKSTLAASAPEPVEVMSFADRLLLLSL